MAKVLKGMRIEMINATAGDPSTPNADVAVTYYVEDSEDSSLAKTGMVTKTVTLTDTGNAIWSALEASVKTDEGIV